MKEHEIFVGALNRGQSSFSSYKTYVVMLRYIKA